VKNVKTAVKIKVETKSVPMMRAMPLSDWLLLRHQRSQTGTTIIANNIAVRIMDATISILSLLQSLMLEVFGSAFSTSS
jgi:hypothetical protein